MAIRSKTRRRLVLMLAGFFCVGLLGTGLYFFRQHQLNQRAILALAQGRSDLAAGNSFAAMHEIGSYVQRFPADAPALADYAFARQSVPEKDGTHLSAAINLYRRVLVINPGNPKAEKALLDLYIKAGFSTEARNLADEVLKSSPTNPEALRAKALAHLRMRQYKEALAAAERLNQAAPTDLDGQVLTLQLLLNNDKKTSDLIDRAQSLLKAHPNDPHFMLLLAVAYSTRNDAAAKDQQHAVAWTTKAAQAGITDAPSALMLANQFSSMGMFDQAIAALDHADHAAPDPRLHKAAISLLWQMDRSKELLSRLNKLKAADPKADADLLGYRALTQLQSGQADQANPTLDQLAVRKNDPNAFAWASVLRSVFAKPTPDHKQQAQTCGDAIAISGDNPVFQFYAGEAYAAIGEQDLAIANWQRAAGLAPAWPLPAVRLSSAYLSRQNLESTKEAVRYAVIARARAPKDVEALRSFVAVGYAIMGAANLPPDFSPDALLKVIDQIQTLSPGDEQTLPIKVAILARAGRKDAAADAVRTILAARNAPGERTLLQIASISRDAKLGMEEACYQRLEKAYGLTPLLAFTRAVALNAAGQSKEGLLLLDNARNSAKDKSSRDWQFVWARYLELVKDSRAKDAWMQIASSFPSDLEIQEAVLDAPSVQSQRDFVNQTIDRVHTLTGDRGAVWRVAHARWVLAGTPTEQELADVVSKLSSVLRDSDDLRARLLLANALERLGNVNGAVEQFTAALALRPNSVPIALDLTRLLQSQHLFDRSRDLLDRLAANPALTPAERAQAARLCIAQGDDARARKFLESAPQGASADDLMLASLYRRQGDVDKALAIYQRLLKNPTEQSVAAAADLYAALDRPNDAQATLALLDKLELKPGLKDAYWGNYYERTGNAEQALARYQAAVAAAPSNPVMWQRLLANRISSGKAQEVLSDLQRAVAAVPSDPAIKRLSDHKDLIAPLIAEPNLRPMLVSLMSSADEKAASEALGAIAQSRSKLESPSALARKLHPLADRYQQCMPLQVLAAQACFEAANLDATSRAIFRDDAANLALRAMQAFPANREPAQASAAILESSGRWAEALDAAKKWRALAGVNKLMPDVAIAQAQIGLGKPKEALDQLAPYLKDSANAPDSYLPVILNAARAHLMLRETTVAADLFRPHLKGSPNWRIAWMQLVGGYPDPKAVATWLEELTPLVPPASVPERLTLARDWLFLFGVTHDEKQRQTARTLLASVASDLQKDPKVSSEELEMLGMLQESTGDEQGAEATYRRSLQIQPYPSISANNLAMLLIRHHSHLDEALALASKAAELNPGVGAYLDTLASAQAAVKKYDPAAQSARSALRSEPDNIGFRLTLIRILADKGDLGQAKAEFQELRRLPMDANKTPPQLLEQIDHMRQQLNL